MMSKCAVVTLMRCMALAVSLAGIGCVQWSSTRAIDHPTPENVPESALRISLAVAGVLSGELENQVLTPVPSEAEEVISEVADVATLPSGDILVLDSGTSTVKLFSRVGRYVATVARAGTAEHQFRAAKSIDVLQDGTVTVLDGSRTVRLYRLDGEGFVARNHFELDFDAEGLCTDGQTLLLRGVDGRARLTIHRLTPTGTRLGSFGPAYNARDERVGRRLSAGVIACHAQAGAVVSAFEYFPIVSAYDISSGSVLWQANFEHFVGPRIQERSGPDGPRLTISRELPFTAWLPIVPLDPGRFVVQLGDVKGASAVDRGVVVHRYLVAARTGQAVRLPDAESIWLGGFRDRVIGLEVGPFYRLRIGQLALGAVPRSALE